MADYYQILTLDRTATTPQIKAAYKRLAMQYHPDRNHGDKSAEEKFKQINEAYHTLVDPQKRFQYDQRLFRSAYSSHQSVHETRRRQNQAWSRVRETHYYKVDRQYFRVQALTLLIFLTIAGIVFTVFQVSKHIIDERNQTQWRINSESLKQVNALFSAGNQEDAFALIQKLKDQDPREYRFHFVHDSLTDKLRDRANDRYDHHDFSGAIKDYLILKKVEEPVRTETLRQISMCQYYLGNFAESVQVMKQLLAQQPNNLELLYAIGIINVERLQHFDEALIYLSMGKALFTKNLTQLYGDSFMREINPDAVPDIYFYIFETSAVAELESGNYSAAVADCKTAIWLRPTESSPYFTRAKARINNHETGLACADLQKAQTLGESEADDWLEKYCP